MLRSKAFKNEYYFHLLQHILHISSFIPEVILLLLQLKLNPFIDTLSIHIFFCFFFRFKTFN